MFSTSSTQWAQTVFSKLVEKMPEVTKRSKNKIPYTTENGVFNDLSKDGFAWWTNGFWGGMMWQMYNATRDEKYKKAAEIAEKKLDNNLTVFWAFDHDNGFKWLPTAVADFKLTNNPDSFNRARIAADNLAGRFNPAGRFIRAWNDDGDGSNAGIAIIDCMMNLPLLYWAYEVTKDPRFYQIATSHADTAMKYFIREDGSSNHIVEFDPHTGKYIKARGGQGMDEKSSWTRGQAWALYGFTLSYIHTKNHKYLSTARKIAKYFISCIPESGHIPVDFMQSADLDWEDSTAAAIAASALLELFKITSTGSYEKAALKLLKTLDKDRISWDKDRDELLEFCSQAYHDEYHNFTIIYGDYFFIEAVLKLLNKDLFIW